MTTISFQVGLQPGTIGGDIDGFSNAAVGVYQADNATGYPLTTTDIFCVSPTSLAATGMASYVVQSGIVGQGTGFSLTQVDAIEGIISHYYSVGDMSPTAMATTALANWLVVDPSLAVSGLSTSIVNNAESEAQQALLGELPPSTFLKFTTFVNANSQNFVNVSPVPLPGSGILLLTALVLAVSFMQARKLWAKAS